MTHVPGDSVSVGTGGAFVTEGVVSGAVGNISVNPNQGSAPWTLYGPYDFGTEGEDSGTGDTAYTDVPSGLYRIVWGQLSGWVQPLPSALMLGDGASIEFEGIYYEAGGAESILTRMLELIENDGDTSSYHSRKRIADDLGVEQWKTGTIELDVADDAQAEIIQFAGLSIITHRFDCRITKISQGGTEAARRAGVLTILGQVKQALSTVKGNFAGHPTVRIHSVSFPSFRWEKKESKKGDANLNKRAGVLRIQCIEHLLSTQR